MIVDLRPFRNVLTSSKASEVREALSLVRKHIGSTIIQKGPFEGDFRKDIVNPMIDEVNKRVKFAYDVVDLMLMIEDAEETDIATDIPEEETARILESVLGVLKQIKKTYNL